MANVLQAQLARGDCVLLFRSTRDVLQHSDIACSETRIRVESPNNSVRLCGDLDDLGCSAVLILCIAAVASGAIDLNVNVILARAASKQEGIRPIERRAIRRTSLENGWLSSTVAAAGAVTSAVNDAELVC